jgi:hypothetical protein
MAGFPKSKMDDCVSIEAGNVFIIRDLHGRELARLDRVTALVWRLADGTTPVQDIVRALDAQFDVAADDEIVWSALGHLADLNILTERFTPPMTEIPSSRRGVIRLAVLGVAAAVVAAALGVDARSDVVRPVPTTAPKPTTTAKPTTTTARPTTTTTRSPTTRPPRSVPTTTSGPKICVVHTDCPTGFQCTGSVCVPSIP